MSRLRITKKKAAWQLGIAVAFAIICVLLLIDMHDSEASKPHVWISGTLTESEIIGLRSPALRLRLKEEATEFRVGIELFRAGMNREIPPGFAQGARVSVLVQREEYAHPTTPQFDRSARIAFVRGLRVNGAEIFGLSVARSWEERNLAWGYALLAAAIAFVLYAGSRLRRVRTP